MNWTKELHRGELSQEAGNQNGAQGLLESLLLSLRLSKCNCADMKGVMKGVEGRRGANVGLPGPAQPDARVDQHHRYSKDNRKQRRQNYLRRDADLIRDQDADDH
jgi:hypothetical protein